MPLILRDSDIAYGDLYIWRCPIEQKTLTDYFDDLGFDYSICLEWHPKRRLEWLTGRKMISLYVPEAISKLKSESNSKPFFPNSAWDISLSHSHGLVALVMARHSIGIDLQMHRHKTLSLFPKFGNDEELEILKRHLPVEKAIHQLWSIKESVYKAHNQQGLSFKNHIRLTELNVVNDIIYATISVGEDTSTSFSCKVTSLENYALSIAVPGSTL